MDIEPAEAAGAPRRLIVRTLATLGAGFAWFAYIDAPITDGAMALFALAVASGFAAVCLASCSAASLRRAAVLASLLSLLLLLASATLTLNLKGTGEEQEASTAVFLRS